MTTASALHPGRSAILPMFLLLAGCLGQTFFGHAHADRRGHAWGLDDAFISYRYAQNLFEGKGLVFNEGVRVEGYSNFLYVLLTLPAFLFTGGMGIYGYATFVNILFAGMALFLWHRRMREQIPASLVALGSILIALWPPLWGAAASGMETTVVLLVVIGVWSVLSRESGPERDQTRQHPARPGRDWADQLPGGLGRDPGSSRGARPGRNRDIVILSILLSASLLLRADGFLLTLIVVPWLILKGRKREVAFILPVVLAVAGAFLLWRYGYYGSLAPNTYHVKISGPVGARLAQAVRQLFEIGLQGGLLPYLLAFAPPAAGLALRGWREGLGILREIPFELAFALGTLSYWLYIGGDQLGDRFLVPLVPMGLALFLRQIGSDWKAAGTVLLVLLLVCLTLAPLFFDGRFTFTASKYDMWVRLGQHLGEHHARETLAVDAAGKIPFFSGLRTLDMLGLNEPEIARKQVDFFLPSHNKYDADYVLAKRPDLIAAFIDPYNLDMSYGLWRVKYEAAGYRLLYLVQGEKDLGRATILPVRGMGLEEIRKHVLEGYFYAVLKRG